MEVYWAFIMKQLRCRDIWPVINSKVGDSGVDGDLLLYWSGAWSGHGGGEVDVMTTMQTS